MRGCKSPGKRGFSDVRSSVTVELVLLSVDCTRDRNYIEEDGVANIT